MKIEEEGVKLDKIATLKKLIDNNNKIVFFGGAGVSTASGIPDFMSNKGVYSEKYPYTSEEILSGNFFKTYPDIFYTYYKDRIIHLKAKPNNCHIALAELEKQGKIKAVVTQNIDGLHQMAGSKNVFELHGSIHRNYCKICGDFYELDYIVNSDDVPKCGKCGGIIKPDVVLYSERLCDETIRGSIKAIENADLFIVGGSSLTVYPAAGLIHYYNGSKLVLINKSRTSADDFADLIINDDISEVFLKVVLSNQ